MRQIIVFCVLLGLNVYFCEACPPNLMTPREREMYTCLKRAGWTNSQMRRWYNRVLNPETRSGRVSAYDQQEVRDCITVQDFLHYGVVPDGYVEPARAHQPELTDDFTEDPLMPQNNGRGYPSSGGVYPNKDGNYPSAGGSYPIAGGGYPNTGSGYPNAGGSYPSPGGSYPIAGGGYPSAGGSYPSPGGSYPSAGSGPTNVVYPNNGGVYSAGGIPPGSSSDPGTIYQGNKYNSDGTARQRAPDGFGTGQNQLLYDQKPPGPK